MKHAFLALCLGLGGCAGLNFGGDDEPTSALGEMSFQIPADWTTDLTMGDRALADGWASLYGEGLAALIEEALANNPDLQASAARVEQAEALLAQSRAALRPLAQASLSATVAEPLEQSSGTLGGFNIGNLSANDQYNAGVAVNWDPDLRGLNRAGKRASQARLDAAHAILEASRRNVAALTALTYFDVINARRQLHLAHRTEEALEETYALVEQLYEYGAVARRDLALSRADLAGAQDTVIAAEQGVRAAQRALEVLVGRYPAAEIDTASQLPSRPALLAADTPLEVLRRRPDLVAAEYQVIASYADSDRARAARWPAFTLSGGFTSSGFEPEDVLEPTSMAISLGASLAQTLFDGGLRQAQIDGADATAREALANYGSAALSALSEVESARDQVATLNARQAVLQDGLDNSEVALELTELRYRAGDTDLIDVLTLRQRVFAAERAVIANQSAQLQAQIQLYQALGGPID
ncbi:MAG: efflux transporter outer membrane subunit [Hyphomonadaceae bacterium]|nr:efflux transporter outer membrane subunit [Hyphomonadaceae bacterium]